MLLSHYSALKVAENFRMLEALAAGRIDLGLGAQAGAIWRPSSRCARTGMARYRDYFLHCLELIKANPGAPETILNDPQVAERVAIL